MQVADWNDYSAGKPWFRGDGLHMGTAGATAFAAFLRPHIFRAALLSCVRRRRFAQLSLQIT